MGFSNDGECTNDGVGYLGGSGGRVGPAPLPLSQQLAAVLRAQIRSGERRPGSRLPTIMKLVEEYGVATATVPKALRILKREGLVIGSTGHGTFVAEHPGT